MEATTPATAKYILWDTRDGYRPRCDEDGEIVSDGLLGRITVDNVYLRTYASYPDDKRPADLTVGGAIKGVGYNLSGAKGTYDVYRVS